jgi:hypothetical protein
MSFKPSPDFLNYVFEEAVRPGANDPYLFQVACNLIDNAVAKYGSDPMDINDALDLHSEISVIPDLVIDARGEEGLNFAMVLEKRLFYTSGKTIGNLEI